AAADSPQSRQLEPAGHQRVLRRHHIADRVAREILSQPVLWRGRIPAADRVDRDDEILVRVERLPRSDHRVKGVTVPARLAPQLELSPPSCWTSDTMHILRSAYLSRVVPDSARAQNILALLLWSGVTVFIFGILIDWFR